MKSFQLDVDEKLFNLLWRSLCERESELMATLSSMPEGSDGAAMLGNDLIYLRLCKRSLEEKGKSAAFVGGAFSTEEQLVELSEL